MTRRCFCADIPPTIAATETGGGGFGLSLEDDASLLSSESCRDRAVNTISRHLLRCSVTWIANSRVGVRIRAFIGRRSPAGIEGMLTATCESGAVLLNVVRRWCRIGRPYASVFPEPYFLISVKRRDGEAHEHTVCATPTISLCSRCSFWSCWSCSFCSEGWSFVSWVPKITSSVSFWMGVGSVKPRWCKEWRRTGWRGYDDQEGRASAVKN